MADKRLNEKKTTIRFLPDDVKFAVAAEETILSVALKNHIELSHSCGGMGSCGTCMIEIRSDLKQLTPRNEVESELAQELGLQAHERLACQLHINGDVVAEIPASKSEKK